MRKIIDGEFIAALEGHDLCRREPMDGMFGGNRRSRAYGSSAEFAEYRDYVPGDDLRRIDWNLYARFEKLLTRLYVDEKQQHHRIYIDASASMDWGEPGKAEAALKMAAAFAYLAVGGLDKASVYTLCGSRLEQVGRTMGSREAFYSTVEELNRVTFRGDTDFAAAICGEENPGAHDGVTIIISDFLTDSDWKAAVDYLLYHGREVWLVQLLSPDELTPDMHGKVLFLDSEAAGEEDLRNVKKEVTRAELKAYAEALRYHHDDMKRFCDARGVKLICLSSAMTAEEMLFMHAAGAEMTV